mgnify:CR=1 FL=1
MTYVSPITARVRVTLSRLANGLAYGSANRPHLRANSSRETLVLWLIWCDPNGVWSDHKCIEEGLPIMDVEASWEQIETLLHDTLLDISNGATL